MDLYLVKFNFNVTSPLTTYVWAAMELRAEAKSINRVQILESKGIDFYLIKLNFNVISPLTTFICVGS